MRGQHLKDMVGKRFGRLLVLRRGENEEGGRVQWICKCDCGHEGGHAGYNLRSGSAKSCGCLAHDMKRENNKKNIRSDTPVRKLFAAYKASARERRLEFSIDLDAFRDLTSGSCFYCDTKPSHTIRSSCHSYVYNGIDRVENRDGYVKGNVVTCCLRCNRAKSVMPQEEFFQWVSSIYAHLKSIGKIQHQT